MSEVEPINSRIESAIYELEDCLSELTGLTDLVDTDGGSLDSIEEGSTLFIHSVKNMALQLRKCLIFLIRLKRA